MMRNSCYYYYLCGLFMLRVHQDSSLFLNPLTWNFLGSQLAEEQMWLHASFLHWQNREKVNVTAGQSRITILRDAGKKYLEPIRSVLAFEVLGKEPRASNMQDEPSTSKTIFLLLLFGLGAIWYCTSERSYSCMLSWRPLAPCPSLLQIWNWSMSSTMEFWCAVGSEKPRRSCTLRTFWVGVLRTNVNFPHDCGSKVLVEAQEWGLPK